MKVQQIQSTNNINSRARFIDDKNGYFHKLWKNTTVNYNFYKTVDQFYKNNKEHVLEITKVYKNEYTIFNHRNGLEIVCTKNKNSDLGLKDILEQIMENKSIFTTGDKIAKTYQKLTGQKVDIDATI